MNDYSRMRQKMVLLGLAAGFTLMAVPVLGEDKPSAEAAVGLYSKYVWRGIEYSKDSLVIQPSLTLGYQGFSANFWSNIDTDVHEDIQAQSSDTLRDDFNLNETDVTLGYEWAMGVMGLGAGYIYYDLDGVTDSQEVFLSAGLDAFLNPTVTAYREIAHFPGWYISAGISHSLPIKGDLTLNLGARVGYWSFDNADDGPDPDNPTEVFSDFHDATLAASMTFPVNEYISVTPELYYSFALSDAAEKRIEDLNLASNGDNSLYGGIAATFAF